MNKQIAVLSFLEAYLVYILLFVSFIIGLLFLAYPKGSQKWTPIVCYNILALILSFIFNELFFTDTDFHLILVFLPVIVTSVFLLMKQMMK